MSVARILALLTALLAGAACSGSRFASDNEDASQAPRTERSDGGAEAGASSNDAGGTSGTGTSAGVSRGGSAHAFGGFSPAAGAPGEDSNADAEGCIAGEVKFLMKPSSDLAPGYLCDASCGTGWLTITDAQGATAFAIFPACGTASCESCEMTACPAAACWPTPLTPVGAKLAWDGRYFAHDVCGVQVSCQRQACVAPGIYRAKACAFVSADSGLDGQSCQPKTEQLCTEVEFEFPGERVVEIVLGP